MMVEFDFSWNCNNGNYYINHSDDTNKWGLSIERAVYQNILGYFYKKGKKEVYLSDEETKRLNEFREKIIQ